MSMQIASVLVHAMGLDNGSRFDTTADQRARIAAAVVRMEAAGVAFTTDEIGDIVGGEQTEVAEQFGPFDGWAELHAVLNEVFDGEGDGERAICCHWPELTGTAP